MQDGKSREVNPIIFDPGPDSPALSPNGHAHMGRVYGSRSGGRWVSCAVVTIVQFGLEEN
jgi:hypothetical protein